DAHLDVEVVRDAAMGVAKAVGAVPNIVAARDNDEAIGIDNRGAAFKWIGRRKREVSNRLIDVQRAADGKNFAAYAEAAGVASTVGHDTGDSEGLISYSLDAQEDGVIDARIIGRQLGIENCDPVDGVIGRVGCHTGIEVFVELNPDEAAAQA